VPAGPRPVQSILIEGTVNVKPSDISARLSTRIGANLTRDTLREDVKEIWSMNRFEDVTVDVSPMEGGYRVTFIVKEQPVLREVKNIGIRELGDKDFKDKITIKEGDYYDPVKVRETEDKIRDVYLEKGYPDVIVKSELVQAEKDKGKMDLILSVVEGPKTHIHKILFVGTKAFPEGALKKVLKNKEPAFFFQSGLYLRDEVDKDKERLQEFYRNEGYLKARVTAVDTTPYIEPVKPEKDGTVPPPAKDANAERKLDLRFTVAEGLAYTLRALTFEGTNLFSPKELNEKVDLTAGAKLSQRKLDEGLNAIREGYTKRGYIYANVVPEYTYDDAKAVADVTIHVREGNIAFIDRILLRGNEETKEKVIMREIDPILKAGSQFDTEKIRKCQERVYNLGFFEDVKIYTEPSLKAGRENLIFEVKERQTGTISLGGGYSSQYGLVGFLQLTKANLFGLGIRVSAEWEIGQKQRNLTLDYFDPYFLDSPVSLGLGFWDTNRDLPNTFKQHSTGGSVTFGHRFGEDWRGDLGYKYEINTVNAYRDANGNITTPLPAGVSEKPQATSSPNVTLTYDTRDSVFDPLRGWTHKWFAQVAGGPTASMNFLGGDAKFYKVQYDASWFIPSPVKLWIITPSLALHTRVGRGWGFDGQDVPIFEKFFLGGTDSIRGYQDRELGPRDPVTKQPAGGLGMGQFNAELKWPVVPRVVTIAAPFFDAGNAWDSIRSLNDLKYGPADPVTGVRSSPIATSVGVGFRLTIPGTIIVIRLDYGWGLTKEYDSSIRPHAGKLHFNIGNIF